MNAATDTAARALFAELTAHEPTGLWSAPGRVNLIGEHTDYNDGFVLPFAIDARTAVAVAARTDGVLRVRSSFDESGASVAIAELDALFETPAPASVPEWTTYPLGVAWALLHAAGFAVEWASYRLPVLAIPAWIWRKLGRSPERSGRPETSDLDRTSPRWVEGILSAGVRFENRLLMAGWRFPFGTSVFVVARKIWSPPPGAAASFDHGL